MIGYDGLVTSADWIPPTAVANLKLVILHMLVHFLDTIVSLLPIQNLLSSSSQRPDSRYLHLCDLTTFRVTVAVLSLCVSKKQLFISFMACF